ncbi:sugar phosphate isomerase/epimerase family protein [Acidicapsa acidisoli]|uniref:sugar phosphate isomerase/epimerase family protein n=1 Tax=Acidicapsa acidisoli TaxID=1615681 RepID=UPI0021DF61C7|nr:sugar phosphate isomerase/epimerase family protein [Acidicapsa acidisoli]
MNRRHFLAGAVAAGGSALVSQGALGYALSAGVGSAEMAQPALKPMAVGLMIPVGNDPEAVISRVKNLGMSNCFLQLDAYVGKFTPALVQEFRSLLEKYEVVATSAEVVGPGRLVWDFVDGPSTIGLVPKASRAARMDALRQTSDFAKLLGISHVQTHCGFIPENPKDPFYEDTVIAIREVAQHCAGNGQEFLMETGQETPTAMLRALKDVNLPNLGVGLDTANLILYGKANPSDALEILGPYVRSVHAKDGKWPTDPMRLGEEVLIGSGAVDFEQVFTKLHKLGYTGAVTIERETSGPQQIEDVKAEKVYLERIISKILLA